MRTIGSACWELAMIVFELGSNYFPECIMHIEPDAQEIAFE